MIVQSRRNFLVGATASLIAAPAIVCASSLMPVKAIKPVGWGELIEWGINPSEHSDAIMALLVQRIRDANRVMLEHMTQRLYG